MNIPKSIWVTSRVMGAAAALATLLVSGRAHATVYQVANYARDTSITDGRCSLREAIKAANTRAQVDTCPAGGTGWNEIDIVGEAATDLNLSLGDIIDITGNLWIIAQEGPGYRQTIVGNSSSFRVKPGAILGVQSVRFKGFSRTPFEVQSGVVPGYGFLRGQLTLTDSEIAQNHGANSGAQSMSILSNGGEVALYGCSIHDNDGAIKGGGVLNQSGHLDIQGCTISNNTVDQYGGAIHNTGSGATLSLINSTLSGNSGKRGGGGLSNVLGAVADIVWSTITNNASEAGGGINVDSSSVVRIKRSIVAGNKNTGPFAGTDCTGTVTSQGYNLLQTCSGTVSATGDIRDQAANLSVLTYPITDNWWFPPFHTPNAGSRAVNAIPSGTEECSAFYAPDDEIRNRRLVGGKCDMGAIERQ